ncbi:histidinol-phosphate transaminase [Mechercharimyces sp. CAU 1602]|uniref:histidinol-phosphate transaminase n=1 Tax=Mechercharimyces sp. CAU 1602 TaxID=2973933 RepID=UPI00216180EC|nr:histidinol-phosphate transaminase [Mechercharimyces sp. CAU 1602]MCS1350996.1 histidinol-phosphate transaminase [Mechercharimyces sp. CAU 1602]
MKAKQRIQDLPVYQPGKPLEEVKRELGLEEVIKLASNENPHGASPTVWPSLAAEGKQLSLYPEGTAPLLRADLAAFYGLPENSFLLGNGSDEIVQMISRSYLEQGDEVVMADVTFPRYKTHALIEGAHAIEVPLKEGTHDLEGMLAAITERTRIIWICNPNNPTGTMVGHNDLISFLKKVPDHILVVADEAYFEYVTDETYPDSLSLFSLFPSFIVLRTFSKIYGLAAIRAGYAIAHPDIIQTLHRVREPFNSNRLAQQAARVALQDQEFVRFCRAENEYGRTLIMSAQEEWGLHAFPAHGNFVMMDTGENANLAYEFLLKHGIIVRPGTLLGYPTYIRVTVGTREQTEHFLNVFAHYISHR